MGLLRAVRPLGLSLIVILTAAATRPALAQPTSDEFVTGQAAMAWEIWQEALDAILAQEPLEAEAAFGRLLDLRQPSPPFAGITTPLRLALLEDRSTRTAQGGGVLLLEQDAEDGKLGPNAQRVVDMLKVGRERMKQADDGWYFAALGRFDVANANFEALLAQDPDPVALLELADRNEARHANLVLLAGNPIIGDSVQEVMAVLREGERLLMSDPIRIEQNVVRLGGPPRAYENAVQLLKDSGEYAVPFLIAALRNPDQRELLQPILRAFPQLGRPALNPLVASLEMPDPVVKQYVIQTLGQIGYPQAVPYLLRLVQAADEDPDVRNAAKQALDTLQMKGIPVDPNMSAAAALFHLAELYYDDHRSLAADPRLEMANVWSWGDDILINTLVPTPIFNEVLCMRLCRQAMSLSVAEATRPLGELGNHESTHAQSLALWLAGNFRREAQLGDAEDMTRPDGFPSAAYFARASGATYCQIALARAVEDNDPVVALGCITALRDTAGAATLLGSPDAPQPLGLALTMPDRMVRLQAGLALGDALPTQSFPESEHLVPVLAEALNLHAGVQSALVVDPDDQSRTTIAGVLRGAGYDVVAEPELPGGLAAVRDLPGTDVIFIASNIETPDLTTGLPQLRSEFRFASTPVVIITKPGQHGPVREITQADYRVVSVEPEDPADMILSAVAEVSSAVGVVPITAERGVELAKQATEVLRKLAMTDNATFAPAKVEASLLNVFKQTDDGELRVAVADVLGYLPSEAAQQAIADAALSDDYDEAMQVALLDALTASAKRQGAHLTPAQVATLTQMVAAEPNTTIRMAAATAQGALSLDAPASELIRTVHVKK